MHDDRNPEGTPRRPGPRSPRRRSSLPAVLLAAVAALAIAAVPPARAGGVSLDRVRMMIVSHPRVGEFPAVVVIVGKKPSGNLVAIGQGVVIDRRGDTCTILTATGVVGHSSGAFVHYADDTAEEVLGVVRWEPAPGLVLLEAKGPCPASAGELLPEKVDPGSLAGPVTVYGAPTWGLRETGVRATLDPRDTGGRRRPRRARPAGCASRRTS